MRHKLLTLLPVLAATLLTGCVGGDDGGETVAPDGAPYSYKVPDGFTIEDPDQLKGIPETFKFTTGVLLDDDNLITVNSIAPVLPEVTEKNRAEQMEGQNKLLKSFGSTLAATIEGPTDVTIDGTPGVEYRFRDLAPPPDVKKITLDADRYIVLIGKRSVNVSCQWKRGSDKEDEVKRGCRSLLASLKLNS